MAFLLTLCAVLAAPHTRVSAEDGIELYINGINTPSGEGRSMIITPEKGSNISTDASAYSWWRAATFEWSDDEGAYIVRSVDLAADGFNGKNNYIPENGFVYLVNIGNDYGSVNYINKYSSDAFYALDNVKAGDKAYLSGIDLDAKTLDISAGLYYAKEFVSNAKIHIGEKPEGVEIYEPDTSAERVGAVDIELESLYAENTDITVEWPPVEGAEYYIVNVNTSANIPDGRLVYADRRTEDTSFVIESAKLSVGMKYTVSVAACAEGKRSSFTARKELFVVSERAATSPFIGKTVVAFGDSLTAITGWVSMLAGELGTDVINSGVGGDKTTEAVARLKKDVLDKEPDIVLIMFGMNDQAMQIASNTPLVGLRAYERNYRKIIEAVLNIGAEPVLMTCNNVCTSAGYYTKGQYGLDYGTGNIQKYFQISRTLAAEYGINLIDINAKIAEEGIKDTAICAPGDGIHLSNEGQKCFTRWISDYLYNDFFVSIKEPEESIGEESSAEESKPEESSEISALPEDVSEQTQSDTEDAQSESSLPQPGGPQDGSGGTLFLILGIAFALAAVAVIAVLICRKKKSK